jgi:hypothetical protein
MHDKVRTRIIELVPEIVELKFGCEVNREGPGREFYVGECGADIALVRLNQHGTWLPYNVPRERLESFKILGRPITYEDCVVAVKRHCGVPDKERADLMQTAAGASCLAIGNRWEWQKPLDEQSDECIEFIGKLLGV